jgi:hypothetical protein
MPGAKKVRLGMKMQMRLLIGTVEGGVLVVPARVWEEYFKAWILALLVLLDASHGLDSSFSPLRLVLRHLDRSQSVINGYIARKKSPVSFVIHVVASLARRNFSSKM